MSLAVEYPSGAHINDDWTRTSMMNVFGAVLPSGSCSLVRGSADSMTRIKTQISKSRDASPADKLSCKGCGRFTNGSSGVNSPKITRTHIQVTHCVTSSSAVSSSQLMTSESVSRDHSIICDRLKNLSIDAPEGLSPSDLASRLKDSPDGVLLMDCRPFIAFNMVHMAKALSLNCCDRLTRKRLKCGKIQLLDIISGEEAKADFRKRKDSSDIIVYDEDTGDLDHTLPDCQMSPLNLVIKNLQKEGHKVFYLEGGLSTFQKNYSEHCIKPDYKPAPKLLYSPTTPAVVDDQIDTAVVSEVLPFLYIGNERDAANLDCLKEHGITHVLNVTSHIPLHFETQGIIYRRLPASDSGHQNLKQYFPDAFTFIEEAKCSGGKVLVHCQAGVSRSATISVSYIMKHSSMTMMEAFQFVKSKRSIVSPNFNFMGQLYELEQQFAVARGSRHLTPPMNPELQMPYGGL